MCSSIMEIVKVTVADYIYIQYYLLQESNEELSSQKSGCKQSRVW